MQKFPGRISFILASLFFLFFLSCNKRPVAQPEPIPPISSYTDLTDLPVDVGGVQTAVPLNSNLIYGYYVYTPSGYSNNQASYPLLIFLHGSGEIGNSMVNPNDLSRILKYGPPELINIKKWSPKYPMIVVSPQSTVTGFGSTKVNNFISYIISKYKVNIHRIYLTGLSMGAGGTFRYVADFPKGYVAAAVPMSSSFDPPASYAGFKNMPIWTFCGANDSHLPNLINNLDNIMQINPTIKPKLTVFPGVGHCCWDLEYSGSGMGTESKSYDAFNMTIYDWMFQYSK